MEVSQTMAIKSLSIQRSRVGGSVKRKIEKREGGELGEACFSGRQLVKRKSRFSLRRTFFGLERRGGSFGFPFIFLGTERCFDWELFSGRKERERASKGVGSRKQRQERGGESYFLFGV